MMSQYVFLASYLPAHTPSFRTSEGPDGLSGLGGGFDGFVALLDT